MPTAIDASPPEKGGPPRVPSAAYRFRPYGRLIVPLPVWTRCRRAGRGRGLLRDPGHGIAVVLEPLGALQRVLRGIHDQVPLVIVLGRGVYRLERNGHILLAHPEEAADADDERL